MTLTKRGRRLKTTGSVLVAVAVAAGIIAGIVAIATAVHHHHQTQARDAIAGCVNGGGIYLYGQGQIIATKQRIPIVVLRRDLTRRYSVTDVPHTHGGMCLTPVSAVVDG